MRSLLHTAGSGGGGYSAPSGVRTGAARETVAKGTPHGGWGSASLNMSGVRTQGQLVGGPHHQQGAEGGQIPAQTTPPGRPDRRVAADHAVDGLGGGRSRRTWLPRRGRCRQAAAAGALQQIPEFACTAELTLKGDDDRIQSAGLHSLLQRGDRGISR